MNQLYQQFGNIDIYLFDQLLKGRFDPCRRILDVGMGGGRNLPYFLQNGFDVYGVDPDPAAVANVQQLAAILSPSASPSNFVVAAAEKLPFADADFDLVICSAVLHFAQDHAHFDAMMKSMWRVLKPGGYFFVRLASDIGIEDKIKPLGEGRYILPDGSSRYLVNENMLLDYVSLFNAVLVEPIKTTNVQQLRCMTTWCLQRRVL